LSAGTVELDDHYRTIANVGFWAWQQPVLRVITAGAHSSQSIGNHVPMRTSARSNHPDPLSVS
jgi:hypothetical protein